MKGLIFDTTVKRGYVAAFDGEREAVRYFDVSFSTQSALIPACNAVLEDLSLQKSDLDGVFAVVGPGSFTGIRIGVTFANAFAFALSLPRFALSSFELIQALCPLAPAYSVDAGHGSTYAAFPEGGALVERNVERSELPQGTVDQSDVLPDLPKGAFLVAAKAFEERAFSACALTHECDYLKPNYMRKSQAERLKEERR